MSDEEENFLREGSFDLQNEPPTKSRSISLFLPQHIFLSTFLGGALAGFSLLAFNYKKLNLVRQFRTCLALAVVVVPSLLGLILLLPDSRWDRAWPVGIAIMMTVAATSIQNVRKLALIRNIVAEPKSIWLAVAVGVFCLFIQFVSIVVFLKFLD